MQISTKCFAVEKAKIITIIGTNGFASCFFYARICRADIVMQPSEWHLTSNDTSEFYSTLCTGLVMLMTPWKTEDLNNEMVA